MTLDTIVELASIPLLVCGAWAYQTGWRSYVLIVSTLHVILGLRLFLHRGGVLLTALGSYGLASAVFLGLPPLWTYLAGVHSIDALDVMVSGISFSVLAITDLVSGSIRRRQRTIAPDRMTMPMIKFSDGALLRTLSHSAVLLMIGLAIKAVEVPLIGRDMIYVSSLFAGLVAITAIRDRKWPLATISSILTLAIVTVFLRVHFSGFGRLNVATLGICFVFLACLIWRSRWIKVVPLLLSGPLLVVAAQIRSNAVITRRSLLGNPFEGLGSMLAPYFTLREVLTRFGMPGSLSRFEFQWGKTLLASVLFWVPRSLWPSKPPGLGFQYTLWFRPDLASVGHSMVASYLSEPYVNFGILGLVTAPLVLGTVLGLIDRAVYQLSSGPRSLDTRYCWKGVSIAVVVAGTADYVWGSSFTVFTRVGSRLIILITIAAIRLLLKQATSRRSHTY